MRLNVVFSDRTVRFYGDRDFFTLLSQESKRLASSSIGDYCEFQTAELNEPTNDLLQYRVFVATDLMDFSTYREVSPDEYDAVFMVIENDDFSKYPKE